MNYLIAFFSTGKKSLFKINYIHIKTFYEQIKSCACYFYWLHLVINCYYLMKFLERGNIVKEWLQKVTSGAYNTIISEF